MAKKEAPAAIPVKRNALKGTSIIITGDIEGQTRSSASQVLINAGATIEKSLNKKVQLVVLGEGAGPKKLEKIEELGLETREWDDLIEEIRADGGEAAGGGEDEDEELDEEEVEEKPKPTKGKAKANTKAKAAPTPKVKPSTSGDFSLAGKTVLITGAIPGHDRKSAAAIVEEAGGEVAKSLNKNVDLVILGTKPGPDKLAKIEEAGIETMQWNDMAGKLGLEVTPEKEVANVETGGAPDSIDGKTVIISGTVEGHTRSGAQKMLESAGAKYAKSLNKQVQLVVLGANAGPDKLNKIAEMGIETCSFEDLVTKLGLEAEASEPPKKKAKKA
ncbi:uncharacterized protein BDR25DRAFT_318838 [Lindgomyces ingoldianus]|uniref:Uncharacterized protein n=1 Tax=Lindgomyces ingoldianus TaxID=673940 RepID=A0ACB6QFE9_9PLEO|nr:uncharacterized protein BDR25DRAFT_318838 [Lindgomyces ingoldianus]KAF2464842.1 hypothetical protein BDR25DRAFT_318838 [Lindgomyces ingoldianus]